MTQFTLSRVKSPFGPRFQLTRDGRVTWLSQDASLSRQNYATAREHIGTFGPYALTEASNRGTYSWEA